MSSELLAHTYQKKTDIEHIKDAPDTYIGSIEPDSVKNWSFNGVGDIEHKNYKWVPGLYKLFDEGIVNCRDHVTRLQQWKKEKKKNISPVTRIDITVNKETGLITMLNDGNGIDIAKHPEHKIWIPQMIFGELRTSTNYDKTQKKIVGGKNGFGFKLVLIYSKYGRVETVDHIRKKKYTQEFKNNLDEICKPTITKCTKKPYTKVEFLPDYERFDMVGLNDDMYNLFKKRVYDIAAVTGKKIKVTFNGEEVPVNTFEKYIDMYIGTKEETPRIYDKVSDRWEYAICLTPQDEFTQVSFVNGVYTSKGGKHVEYILNQVVKNISEYIKKKKKITVKPMTIKEQLMVFVNCVIENPSFDSQTKDYLNTPVSRFGSKCDVSDKVVNKLIKLGIVDAAISLTEIKDKRSAKKTDGRKTRNIRGIPKLIDANKAGTTKSGDCTLILCEGDSAKAGIVSGLSKEDRNFYGVFPLKGKLLNTLDAPQKKINDNAEITNIKKILGLETNKSYVDEALRKKSLRYGKVLIMTDQDLDGAHIKGLCINMFQSQWRDLVKVPNFIGFMNTPIIKATKGKKVKSFYNEADYKAWKQANNDGKGWKIKYYKGLGTSTAKEFKEYFAQKKVVMFEHGENCDNAIDKVFNKKRADDRKEWLGNYDRESVLNIDDSNIPYSDFVDREMIHFSKYDCERSIPNAMDGLKISTRKILFAAKKRNLVNEIKVAQFAGYVSEHACYHHGEMSLNKAIIGLAQEYVGSNNINTLMPNGQFGTRLQGGKDHASERYIFTQLNPLAKYIYREEDDNVLNYLDDDGTKVEPDMYAPILPMCIVNGGKGIGTGFSYDGLSYNPLQIVEYLKYKLNGEEDKCDLIEFTPYYEGFNGSVTKINETKYLIKGDYKIIGSDMVQVTELPIGLWTDDYKTHLESLMDDSAKSKKKPIIKSFNDMSTDSSIDFTIKFHSGILQKIAPEETDYECNMLEKKLKLYTTKNTTNMHLFDSKQQLKKYKNVEDIIDIYYHYRYGIYIKRKEFQITKLKKEVKILSNKAKFIKEQCDDIIDLRKKKKQVVIDMLKERNYDIIDEDEEYKYLRTMKIEDVEEENMEKLLKQRDIKIKELSELEKMTVENIWMNELDIFSEKYLEYKRERSARLLGKEVKKKRKKKLKLQTK